MVVRVPEKRPQMGLRVSFRLAGEEGGWIGGPVTTAGLREVIAKGGLWPLARRYKYQGSQEV